MLSEQPSVDVVAARRGDGAGSGSPSEAAAASSNRAGEGEGGDGDGDEDDNDGDEAALAAATAAAAEELAAVDSHSLTQGAMKLVYLLAIQVRARARCCRGL